MSLPLDITVLRTESTDVVKRALEAVHGAGHISPATDGWIRVRPTDDTADSWHEHALCPALRFVSGRNIGLVITLYQGAKTCWSLALYRSKPAKFRLEGDIEALSALLALSAADRRRFQTILAEGADMREEAADELAALLRLSPAKWHVFDDADLDNGDGFKNDSGENDESRNDDKNQNTVQFVDYRVVPEPRRPGAVQTPPYLRLPRILYGSRSSTRKEFRRFGAAIWKTGEWPMFSEAELVDAYDVSDYLCLRTAQVGAFSGDLMWRVHAGFDVVAAKLKPQFSRIENVEFVSRFNDIMWRGMEQFWVSLAVAGRMDDMACWCAEYDTRLPAERIFHRYLEKLVRWLPEMIENRDHLFSEWRRAGAGATDNSCFFVLTNLARRCGWDVKRSGPQVDYRWIIDSLLTCGALLFVDQRYLLNPLPE
jgi:hypothetical protein